MQAWLSVLVPVGFLGWLFWAAWRRSRARLGGMAADRADLPYNVFSREHDVECRGSEMARHLDDAYSWHYPGTGSLRSCEERLAAAERAYAESSAKSHVDRLPEVASGKIVIALVLDQSGSMADRIPKLAGQLRASCEALAEKGYAIGLFGHTTRGWQGGRSRRAWKANGSPVYPGRLADLLHVAYKDFDVAMDQDDWSAMILPNALHENIDGEALEWVASKVSLRPEPTKVLIVLSDGASVDDSSLNENGAGFLERHLLEVISAIEATNEIELAAIGIDHRVERYFKRSTEIEDAADFPQSLVKVIQELT